MTPAQKKVARHILSLPNRSSLSATNRSNYGVGSLHDLVAQELVKAGFAIGGVNDSSSNAYSLLPNGARQALESGERLSPADFPPEGVIVGGHPSEFF